MSTTISNTRLNSPTIGSQGLSSSGGLNASGAQLGGQTQPINITLQLDGKTIYQSVMQYMSQDQRLRPGLVMNRL